MKLQITQYLKLFGVAANAALRLEDRPLAATSANGINSARKISLELAVIF
jgi:hypothetical protein